MISILSKAATWSPEQPFGEAFSRVFSSRLCSAQLIWTAVAAYGDLLTGILALLVLVLLRIGFKGAMGTVWLFNVVGTVDLLNALRHVDVVPDFGAVWYIPTLYVPLLLVTHFMIFGRLLKPLANPEKPASK